MTLRRGLIVPEILRRWRLSFEKAISIGLMSERKAARTGTSNRAFATPVLHGRFCGSKTFQRKLKTLKDLNGSHDESGVRLTSWLKILLGIAVLQSHKHLISVPAKPATAQTPKFSLLVEC